MEKDKTGTRSHICIYDHHVDKEAVVEEETDLKLKSKDGLRSAIVCIMIQLIKGGGAWIRRIAKSKENWPAAFFV